MKSFYTTTNKSTQGRRAFDVNTVIGFQEIECGFSATEAFSPVMNIKCLSSFPFKQLNKKVMVAYISAAKRSMATAAKKVLKIDFVNDIILYACFNSWFMTKRGHSSLHVVVTSIPVYTLKSNQDIPLDVKCGRVKKTYVSMKFRSSNITVR